MTGNVDISAVRDRFIEAGEVIRLREMHWFSTPFTRGVMDIDKNGTPEYIRPGMPMKASYGVMAGVLMDEYRADKVYAATMEQCGTEMLYMGLGVTYLANGIVPPKTYEEALGSDDLLRDLFCGLCLLFGNPPVLVMLDVLYLHALIADRMGKRCAIESDEYGYHIVTITPNGEPPMMIYAQRHAKMHDFALFHENMLTMLKVKRYPVEDTPPFAATLAEGGELDV